MIRSLLPVVFVVLTACNGSPMKGGDPRQGESGAEPGTFSLADSQTCGVTPLPDLPDDPTAVADVTLDSLKADLEGPGIDGWVHASVPEFGEYVFSYRTPGEFFAHLEMAMIPSSPEIATKLNGFKRNDKIHVVGSFVNKLSPLGHIMVTSAELVKKFEPNVDVSGHQYSESMTDLFTKLKADTAIYGVVHAQTTSGGVVVLDYDDIVLPVFVSEPHREFAKTLFRGDVVGIAYKIRESPNQPPHLETNGDVKQAIEIYDHMVWCHEKQATLSGELVVYEQSPQIKIDVFALRHTDANGMQRNWTLINFDDMDVFTAIQEKLAKVWADGKATATIGRNFQINPKIRVTAKGKMNVVSPSQANPQLGIANADDLTFEILP